jgi:hypothetical protein
MLSSTHTLYDMRPLHPRPAGISKVITRMHTKQPRLTQIAKKTHGR